MALFAWSNVNDGISWQHHGSASTLYYIYIHDVAKRTDPSYIGIITFACECNSRFYRERIIHPTVNIHSIPALGAIILSDMFSSMSQQKCQHNECTYLLFWHVIIFMNHRQIFIARWDRNQKNEGDGKYNII